MVRNQCFIVHYWRCDIRYHTLRKSLSLQRWDSCVGFIKRRCTGRWKRAGERAAIKCRRRHFAKMKGTSDKIGEAYLGYPKLNVHFWGARLGVKKDTLVRMFAYPVLPLELVVVSRVFSSNAPTTWCVPQCWCYGARNLSSEDECWGKMKISW